MAMMTPRRWRRGFLLTSQELNVDQIDSSNNLPGREPLMKPTQMCHTPDWIILLFSFFMQYFNAHAQVLMVYGYLCYACSD